MANRKFPASGIVYSTDKDFKFAEEPDQDQNTGEQKKITVKLDKKHRGGKVVTIITGYPSKEIDEAGKKLKMYCGTGGSVKDYEIIIQGDHRDKVVQWLQKAGIKDIKRI